MTHTSGPKAPEPAGENPPPSTESFIARSKRRVRNGLIDIAVFCTVSLPIAYVFESFVSKESLQEALRFQEDLYNAVKDLTPFGLLYHILDFHLELLWSAKQMFSAVFPSGLVDLAVPILFLITGGLVIGLTPIALPVLVVVNGNPLELFLVLVVFLPLVIALREHGAVGLLLALGVTTLFFGLLQLVMFGSLFLFGKVLSTASTWMASSTFACGAFWCVSQGAEQSLSGLIVKRTRAAIVFGVSRTLGRLS